MGKQGRKRRGLHLPKSNLIFIKKCLDKWVHFNIENKAKDISNEEVEYIIENIGEPFVKRKLQRDLYYKRLAGQHNDKN